MLEGYSSHLGYIKKAIYENDFNTFKRLVGSKTVKDNGARILLAVIQEKLSDNAAVLEASYPYPFGTFWERQGDIRARMINHVQELGVAINSLRKGITTPLHVAASMGPHDNYLLRAEIIRHLVGRGADGDARDGKGRIPRELFLQNQVTNTIPQGCYEAICASLEDAESPKPLWGLVRTAGGWRHVE
jgi:hypothetical protein